MPGKKEDASSYTFMSQLRLHREVAAADTVSQSAIEGISEYIPLNVDEDDPQLGGVSIARRNALIIGVLFPTAVTSVTVDVFVRMKGNLSVSNFWALVESRTLTFSGHISICGIHAAECKVLVSALVGSGTVQIVYSKSA